MSALCAVFRRDRAAVDPGCARAILDAQRARGPDAANVWAEGAIAIGHGLFATTPEDRLGAQPWKTSEGRVVVALDGRIDNREEIAAWTGARLNDVPDVGPVAAAYEAWGGVCGATAGGFCGDRVGRAVGELIAARDVVGGGLSFSEEGREVRCASHAGAVRGDGRRGCARASMRWRCSWWSGTWSAPQTLLEGVRAVAPGETRRFGGRARGAW
ncbi:MAG: hypothetical protein R3F14_12960 [Polyangiaceae bacterium]